MDILKRGVYPGEDTFRGTCGRCQTEVRFKRSEATTSGRPGEPMILGVICPVCQFGIFVDSKKPDRKAWEL